MPTKYSSSLLLVPQSTCSSLHFYPSPRMVCCSWCFFFDPLKIFRKVTTYFLVGLSIADILTATTQQPMYATCFTMIYIKHRETGKTCQTLITVGQHISLVAMNCSFIIVLSFTIAQFIVVISPLKYAQKVTKCRVIICIIGIYAYAILLTLLPKMGVHRDVLLKFDTIFHSIILTYLIIIFYVLLFITFIKKIRGRRVEGGELVWSASLSLSTFFWSPFCFSVLSQSLF